MIWGLTCQLPRSEIRPAGVHLAADTRSDETDPRSKIRDEFRSTGVPLSQNLLNAFLRKYDLTS